MDLQAWFDRARLRVLALEAGKRFRCRDLFDACTWDELSHGEKIAFGRFFANEVREGRLPEARHVGKAENNHSQYERV